MNQNLQILEIPEYLQNAVGFNGTTLKKQHLK